MDSFLALAAAAALKAALLLALGGMAVALLRSASASTRHLVWTISVAAALVLPVAGIVLDVAGGPRIPLSMWQPTVTVTADIAPAPAIDKFRASEPMAVANPLSAQVEPAVAAEADASVEPLVSPITAEFKLPVLAAMVAPAMPGLFGRSPSRTLLAVWLAGALAALLPVAFAMLRVADVSRRARLVQNSRWHRVMAETPAIRHMASRVRIVESDTASMPMTWGLFRSTLLLPSNADRWNDSQCRNILLHELAHVERRDCLTQVVAQLACAVYWFNPLSWVAAHRMRVERELACDDVVISAGSIASDYAENLLQVARLLHSPAFTSQSAIAMARPSQLSGRLLAVLDTRRDRRSVSPRLMAGAAMTALIAVVVLASLTPRAADAAMSSDRDALSPIVAGASEALPVQTLTAPARAFPLPAAIVRATQLPAAGLVPSLTAIASGQAASIFGPVAKELGARLPGTGALALQGRTACWLGAKDSKNTSVSINSNDSDARPSLKATFKQNACTLELRAEGKFTLHSDLTDVESISSGGWLRVEENDGRTTKRVEVRPSGSSLEHIYYVNGRRAEYDDNARAWLAQTLIAVERRTAFAADTRVPQIYRRSGVRGVLDEISQMGGTYAKSQYFEELLGMNVSLDTNALNEIVRRASEDLSDSDYYTYEVLKNLGRHGAANESTWRTFAETAGRMKSDYYKSELLKGVLAKGKLSPSTVGTLLRSASGIDSDHYLTELLKEVAGRYALNEDTQQFYADALKHVKSDYYRSELLKTMKGARWDSRTKAFVLSAVGDISSDYYRSESLISLAKDRHVDDWPAFFRATESIDSDHYKGATTEAVLDIEPLTKDMVAGALSVAQKIDSDYEAAELLSTIARRYRMDDELRAAYERALEKISSSYYKESARSALLRSASR